MTFTALKARVANETGLDATVDDTLLGVWVNAIYKRICGLQRWPWLLTTSTLQTVADITTGTVSINAASTALTFSSGPAVSVANQYMIKFTSVSDDWYLISAHNAASTSATLANAFLGTSNLSGGAYVLRKVYYSLPSTCDGLVDIREAVEKRTLAAVDIRTFDRYLPDPASTGTPNIYALAGLDTSGAWQITPYPIPDAKVNLQLRFYKLPADMSTGSDTPTLPEKFHDAIVYGSLYYFGHPYQDDSRIATAKVRYDQAIDEMKRNYNPIPAQMNILQTWDTRGGSPHGELPYPSNIEA